MIKMERGFSIAALFKLIFVLCLFSGATGLKCYVTAPNGNDKAIDCSDNYVVPSSSQLHMVGNATAPKLLCFKRGFIRGCALAHKHFRPHCTNMTDPQFMLIVESLDSPDALRKVHRYGFGGSGGGGDYIRECFCDSDRCNEGNKVLGGMLIFIFTVAVITMYVISLKVQF